MPAKPIDLVILRHGEAGNASSDRERSLTNYGQNQITSQCQWLEEQGFNPDLVLHSPYRRTVQTAQLVNERFPNAELSVEPLITPDGDPNMVSSLIPALDKQQILVASHMPFVSYLTATLLDNTEIFSFPVAGLCWLQIPDNSLPAKILHKHWY